MTMRYLTLLTFTTFTLLATTFAPSLTTQANAQAASNYLVFLQRTDNGSADPTGEDLSLSIFYDPNDTAPVLSNFTITATQTANTNITVTNPFAGKTDYTAQQDNLPSTQEHSNVAVGDHTSFRQITIQNAARTETANTYTITNYNNGGTETTNFATNSVLAATTPATRPDYHVFLTRADSSFTPDASGENLVLAIYYDTATEPTRANFPVNCVQTGTSTAGVPAMPFLDAARTSRSGTTPGGGTRTGVTHNGVSIPDGSSRVAFFLTSGVFSQTANTCTVTTPNGFTVHSSSALSVNTLASLQVTSIARTTSTPAPPATIENTSTTAQNFLVTFSGPMNRVPQPADFIIQDNLQNVVTGSSGYIVIGNAGSGDNSAADTTWHVGINPSLLTGAPVGRIAINVNSSSTLRAAAGTGSFNTVNSISLPQILLVAPPSITISRGDTHNTNTPIENPIPAGTQIRWDVSFTNVAEATLDNSGPSDQFEVCYDHDNNAQTDDLTLELRLEGTFPNNMELRTTLQSVASPNTFNYNICTPSTAPAKTIASSAGTALAFTRYNSNYDASN